MLVTNSALPPPLLHHELLRTDPASTLLPQEGTSACSELEWTPSVSAVQYLQITSQKSGIQDPQETRILKINTLVQVLFTFTLI
jgi:hypothetical protein